MKYTLLIFFLIFGSFISAQTNLQVQYRICNECNESNGPYTYGPALTYQTSQIESDYDNRIVSPGSKFHQGLDFIPRPNCRGDAILAVEAGTISNIYANDQFSLKSISITTGTHAFVYLHIFNSNEVPTEGMRSGNFILMPIPSLPPNTEYAIIVIRETDTIALAESSTWSVEFNGTTFQTRNTVSAGDMIAPIGNSGARDFHLHLALMEGVSNSSNIPRSGRDEYRSIDPWTMVEHVNNGFNFRMRTRKKGNYSNNNCEHTGLK